MGFFFFMVYKLNYGKIYVCKHIEKIRCSNIALMKIAFLSVSIHCGTSFTRTHPTSSLQELHSKPSTQQEEYPSIYICSILVLRNLQSKLVNVILDKDIV